MAKVTVTKLRKPSNGKSAQKVASVGQKRVRDKEGRVTTIRTLDADSQTFGDALTYVFQRNVAKARDENKRIVGTRDFTPGK